MKLGTCILYVFLCKAHVQVIIGAQFLLVSTYKFLHYLFFICDYIDVNSRQSFTIYDRPKTMKLEGSTVSPLYLVSIIFSVFMTKYISVLLI